MPNASLTNEELVELLLRSGIGVTKPKTVSRVPVVERPMDERRYYKVCVGPFATIVNARDCTDVEEASRVALSDPLCAWYLDKSIIEADSGTLSDPAVVTLTHDQYCNWLRRHN